LLTYGPGRPPHPGGCFTSLIFILQSKETSSWLMGWNGLFKDTRLLVVHIKLQVMKQPTKEKNHEMNPFLICISKPPLAIFSYEVALTIQKAKLSRVTKNG